MFRRSTKLTALLVAAAAVTSIAPASAAERLGNKDGNITNAIAFDGGYIYDGYRTDDDDAALYYNNGEKDKNIDEDEDYDSYDLFRYGTKYATVKDGNDEYLVDVSTGKIDDEETTGDKLDNAKNKLKSKINKEDRYEGFKANGSSFATNEFTKVLNGKYGEVWYKYIADGDSDVLDRVTTGAGAYIGFTNDSGKYIDVCQTANMYVYDKIEKKTVKVEDYGKNYGKNNISVKLDEIDVVAQDKDNLYAVTKVLVNDTDTQYFFQKISKAQGDKKDGAYLPKNVTSYQLDNKSIYDDGDMEKAYQLLVDGNDADNHDTVNVEVSGGMIYVTTITDGNSEKANVKMYKLKFKKDKIDALDGKENVDTYMVKKDGDGDHDTKARNSDKGDVYSIDVEGNTWILDKGKIYKVDGTDFKEVYTVDRSMDKLDVYNEKNLIAWDSTGEVYTTVTEGSKQTADDAGVIENEKKDDVVAVKAGWDKNADGTWSYYVDGAKKTGWVNDNGTWYYIKADGIMATGWVQDGGNWYYLQANGAMKTGWVQDGSWYYLNASGAMVTGWFQDADGSWYYLNANGSMAANTTVDGYVLGANGAWVR
ncbi:N-acetylmuramoyl-L-alanine amidase family protein [uncultured Clostridium sp.]|uniref:N-acetylmuramoyl-L-alanine amidase family protein n=1 Tax=uncultured Clostridium sp. TaxID=59620 RepID=UPI0025E6A075|nr:N-acetylmuramoyl-L-alanine amidase family protein [uncultured Clostridium sp.]